MTATLRGSKAAGYRTTAPLACPHCDKPVHMAATAADDRLGPHLLLWAVAPRAEYSDADLARIYGGPKQPLADLGIALPQPAGVTRLEDDPVPDFRGTK